MRSPRPPRAESAPQSSRETILLAARDLFFEKGMAASSMRDIAGRAGMAQSSLYNHFPTKEALTTAVMERSFARVDSELHAVFESSPPSVELLRLALRAHALQHVHGIKESTIFELERRHMPAAVRDLVVLRRRSYEKRFFDLAGHLAERGCITPDETQVRLKLVLSAGRDMSSWFRPGGRLSEHDLADLYADISLRALNATTDPIAGAAQPE
jgi:AcrR family transcriptional regulator